MKVTIKEAALAKGHTLYELARLLGLPQQTIYSWAKGRTQPNTNHIDMLCQALDCDIQDLFKAERREPRDWADMVLNQKLSRRPGGRKGKTVQPFWATGQDGQP